MAEDYEKGQVMKICTITCHDVYNVGASLQAYALQTYLKSLGHDVKIIDYKPDYLSKHYRLDVVGNPKYDRRIFWRSCRGGFACCRERRRLTASQPSTLI